LKNLKFFDEGHRYELDGIELPSVSEISRFASREVYGNDISKYVLDKACERGTAVHKATEELDKTGKCEISPEYVEYLNAYVKFRKDFNIKEYTYIEKPLADEETGYAGTLDRVYVIDEDFAKAVKKHCKTDISNCIGKYAIIDLKTSSTVKKQLAQIQLPAYSNLLCSALSNCADFLGILHLKKDGKYKLTPYEDDLSLFNACLTLHKAFAKKSKKESK
jgi:hypothetical protein